MLLPTVELAIVDVALGVRVLPCGVAIVLVIVLEIINVELLIEELCPIVDVVAIGVVETHV